MSVGTTIRLSVLAGLAFWALIYYEAGLFGITAVLVFYVGLAILGAAVSGVLGWIMRGTE